MSGPSGAAQRVLVVDDEPQLLRALSINLRARSYAVELAATGAEALAQASRTLPDVVLLDLGLPDMDGVEVIHGLRGWSTVPIVVLSARRDLSDKVQALDAGADDYVIKPFAMDELLARLRAALRRGDLTRHEDPLVVTAAFTVDLTSSRVIREGVDVRLTATEWHVLEVLARHAGQLVGHRQLLQEAWGPGYGTESNYLRLYMNKLRAKLEPEPARPRHLITEAGLGFRLQI